jgi:hypothetical protein
MEHLDRQSIVKNFEDKGISVLPDSLTYALLTWTSKSIRFKSVEEAMRSTEFTSRVKKSFANMLGIAKYTLPSERFKSLENVILEHPKVIVGPHVPIDKQKLLDTFKDLGEVRLPFPAMTFVQAMEGENKVGLIDGFGHVFMQQKNDFVEILCFLGNDFAKMSSEPRKHLKPFLMAVSAYKNKITIAIGTQDMRDGACIPSEQLMEEIVLSALNCIYKTTINDSGEGYYIAKPTPRDIRVNRKKLSKKKAPLIEFRLVKIEPTKPQLPTLPHGTHASPRQHWRRGHWRTCKSGKRVFISPMLVGDEANGKIIKDYIVENPTHAH